MKYLISILILISLTSCNFEQKQNQQFSQEQLDSIRAYELYNSALAFNLQGKDIQALPLYDSAIALISQDPDFYNNRGLTKEALRDTMGAITDFYKAIEMDSLYVTAYQNLGAMYGEIGYDSLSLYYAEKAWKLEPSSTKLFNIGVNKYMLKDYEGCILVFLDYLKDKKSPLKKTAFYYLGNSYSELNDSYNAQRCWDKANELAGYDFKAEMDKTHK